MVCLIHICDLHCLAYVKSAGVRSLRTHYKTEKCSLSGAVGSDDADLLSAPDAEGQFHQEPEPQAPEVPEESAPVTLEWKSEFNAEKYEKELQERQGADHDGQ